MKYRSRTDIIEMILQAASAGATKTRIMYSAYLSYSQLKEYLSFLIERNLISYEEGTQLYKLTERGLGLLRACEGMSDLIALEGQKAVNSLPHERALAARQFP
ncbi:MAG: winged helix-turn-helix domain-containing protein [Nitrososphaerales archaeon]